MVELLRQMILARCIDVVEEELAASGEVFFQVSGAGHEATAVLSRHLGPEDWLHCHYRDKALMLARGLTLAAFFDGVFCNARSHSAGRQMSAHLSAPELKILSIVAPVGNHALQAVGIAQAVRDQEAAPIVLCSSGEGTTQEGEFLEAVAEAVRSKAPVLFWIANNGLAISTRTAGKTFFSPPDGDAGSFHGVPILRLRGSDVLGCDAMARELVAAMRRDRRPRIVVMDVPRLCNHTSADDESLYRSTHELLETLDENDPVFSFANTLMSNGLCDADLTRLLETSMAEVRAAMKDSMAVVEHPPLGAVKRQLDSSLTSRDAERRGKSTAPPVTMLEAFRGVLRQRLVSNPSTFLYGEDIEDPKGDVFRLTAGLSTSFPTRVVSSPLSESTIVGTCIGRALAGQRPVAFIQFADFLPLAFNQIVSELATMHWRTNGGWSCPLVIMAPCGAYRPGLGPFHAQTFESSLAHEPGLDVAVPSTAADASGILNAAFAGARPTVILYPKALLNDRSRAAPPDVASHLAPIGCARTVRSGTDLTLVCWGNTVPIAERVADTLTEAAVSVDVIDLRWISPWDKQAVLRSVRQTRRLLVAHEDNLTCGFGAEILATVAESAGVAVQAARVARPDTYIPCNFANQLEVVPSFRRTLTAAAGLLGLDVQWERSASEQLSENQHIVQAVGSSPSDETVIVAQLSVTPGDEIAEGDVLASLDCNKALFDLTSPVAGVVEEVVVKAGDEIPVGSPVLKIRTTERRRRQIVREECGRPRIIRRG